jgi:pilus assembly protein Flp/PilA
MWHIRERIRRLWRSEEGPTAVEYAVLLGLIVVVAVTAIRALGGGVEGRWQQNAQQIIDASRNASPH